ncbi:UNVERIFIED_ORG: hypothetical protein GGI66_005799 [Rhizobium esperanzae]
MHWLLLTTHALSTATDAWQIVAWYKQRWMIEQFFRVMKTQGFKIEDSQLQLAARLEKLVAIAAKAAAIVLQLVQDRSGGDPHPASLAVSPQEINTLAALESRFKGKTKLQSNPHPKASLAWAAWIIAKLSDWNGYASSKPPGPSPSSTDSNTVPMAGPCEIGICLSRSVEKCSTGSFAFGHEQNPATSGQSLRVGQDRCARACKFAYGRGFACSTSSMTRRENASRRSPDTSISGRRLARELTTLIEWRGKLAMISPTTAPNSPRMPFLPGQKTIGSSGSLRHLAQDSG